MTERSVTETDLWQQLTSLAVAQGVQLAAVEYWRWQSEDGDWDVWLNPHPHAVTVRRGVGDEPATYDFLLAPYSAFVEYRAMPVGDITPSKAVVGVGISGYAHGTAATLGEVLQEELAWYDHLDEAAAELNAQHAHEITACPLTLKGEHCPICGTNRPHIVCLCGSTRFWQAYQEANLRETVKGNIVLTVGCDTKSDAELFTAAELARLKPMLDLLHLRKIDLADEVLILNVGGYIGDSTRTELAYARAQGKTIRFLEPTCIACDCCGVTCFNIDDCGTGDCTCCVTVGVEKEQAISSSTAIAAKGEWVGSGAPTAAAPYADNIASLYLPVFDGDCSRDIAGLGAVMGHYELSRDRESGDCWRSEDYRLLGGYVLFADDEATSNPDAPIAADGAHWHLATSDCYWLVAFPQPLADVITLYQQHLSQLEKE